MILEGIVTTLREDGSVNISPMGPEVGEDLTRLVLKPYQSSRTYKNLRQRGEGVFHVTDDVELLARAAIGRLDPLPELLPAESVSGFLLANACRWYAFRVVEMDDSGPRTRIECRVVDRGRFRDFFGFNRAKHAVVEAAILATRIEWLPPEQIRGELQRLSAPVEKTAGEQERRAFALLTEYMESRLAERRR